MVLVSQTRGRNSCFSHSSRRSGAPEVQGSGCSVCRSGSVSDRPPSPGSLNHYPPPPLHTQPHSHILMHTFSCTLLHILSCILSHIIFRTSVHVLTHIPSLAPLHTHFLALDAIGGIFGVRDRADGKQGSSFYFTFPYRPDYSAIEDAENCSHKSGAKSMRSSSRGDLTAGLNHSSFMGLAPLRILLADDSASILKVTTR